MKILKRLKLLGGMGLLFLFLAACSSLAVATPAPIPVATRVVLPSATGDDATSGAKSRSTREAKSTQDALDAQATVTQQALEASQTAKALTATVVAQVTGQAVVAAKSNWKPKVSESFKDNAQGWPLGVTTDTSPVVTSSIENGAYLWSVVVPHGNSYINLIPSSGRVFSSFSAGVTIAFLADDAGDQTSYGLVFRGVGKDYGFFGISKSGDFRILEVHHSGIYSLDQESSEFINTDEGQSNRIAVVGIGPDFVFLINDHIVGQMNAELDPGQVGLGVDALTSQGETKIRFSDFEVDAP